VTVIVIADRGLDARQVDSQAETRRLPNINKIE
jgi:hypothetical protein